VVRTPRDADIGAIFGIGFPAFRGGPLRMIDDLGAGRVVETLYQLQEQLASGSGLPPHSSSCPAARAATIPREEREERRNVRVPH